MTRTPTFTSALAAAALALLAGSCRQAEESAPPGAPQAMPPIPVEASVVRQQPVRDVFRAVGTVEARDAIVVSSEIDGRVVDLPFREGERVSQGQVLARLDDVQVRAEVARAQALLQHAQVESRRAESLVEQEIMPAQSRDQTRADLDVALADAALQRARLDKTVIRAPYAGVVGSRRVSPGAYVRAGSPITELAAIDTIKVAFAAPERVLGDLAPGSAVTITTPAFEDVELQGEVSVVDPMIDPATRSARVLAVAPNPQGLFKPGMSATVDVLLAERGSALTLPNEAVFVQGTQSFVFVIGDDRTVKQRAVQLGTRLTDVVEVLSGVQEGEIVVRTGHHKLFEGAKALAIDPAAASGAGGGPGGGPAAGPDGGAGEGGAR